MAYRAYRHNLLQPVIFCHQPLWANSDRADGSTQGCRNTIFQIVTTRFYGMMAKHLLLATMPPERSSVSAYIATPTPMQVLGLL